MGRLWHNYKERRLKKMKSGSFTLAFVRTFVRFQADPAAFGSNGIVHLTKVDSCKALRVVADFQLPDHAV